jgi:hypothetical protein
VRTPFRLLIALLVLAGAAFGVSACGSKKGSDKSVSELLSKTFGGGQAVKSGRLSLGLSLDLQGLQGVNGPITAKLSGPFKTKKNEIPEFALDLSISAQGTTFTAGATSIGGKGFLSFQGSDYAVPANVFAAFQQGFKQAQKQQSSKSTKNNPSLKSLGIDPTTWLKNPKKVGTEKVGGTDTVHIASQIDVPKLLADINVLLARAAKLGISRQQQIPTKLTDAQISQIAAAVRSAQLDVFTGNDDQVLRRLVLALGVDVPQASQQNAGGLSKADIKLTLQIDDLNGDQSIKAPASPKPFSQLQSALGGLGLGSAGAGTGATGSTTPGAAGGTAAPGGATGAGGTNAAAANAYLDCINAAKTDAQRSACVSKLAAP